jgi:sec-independent protein translocase protein TatA
MLTLAWTLGFTEILVLAVLGLLIFGKRLPEVGRNLGKGIVEFKKGLAGVEDDVNKAAASQPKSLPQSSAPALPAQDNQSDEIAKLKDQLRAVEEKLKASSDSN